MTDKFREAYHLLEKSLSEAEDFESKVVGPCQKCKYFLPPTLASFGMSDWFCTNPLVSDPTFDPVSGTLDLGHYCMGRSYDSQPTKIPPLCGKYRELFQPKPTLWQRLFGY